MPSRRSVSQSIASMPAVDDQGDEIDRELRERQQGDSELRRIHVPLLIVEDGVVERGIGRVPVEDRVGSREVCEAHVPREEVFAPG